MRQRGRADLGGWAAGWRDARWLGLYWAVFLVLCAAVSRWAYLGCRAEGPAGACGAPAFYLGVVLAALPSGAVVALAAALALAAGLVAMQFGG
jgi:hypothetical protein